MGSFDITAKDVIITAGIIFAANWVINGEGCEGDEFPDRSRTEVLEEDADYIVEAGDSTWSIAQKCSVNDAAFTVIYEAIKDDTIHPGQALDLPEGDGISC